MELRGGQNLYTPGIICRKIVFLLKLFVLVKQSWLTVLELEQIEGVFNSGEKGVSEAKN